MLDLLAFGAHPDDVELFAAGTIAKCGAQGYATGIIDMTRGEMGSRGTAAARAKEARDAGKILGARCRVNLGLPDSRVQVSLSARLKVIRVLRKYRPSVVLVHHWQDWHPDHVNTSRIVTEAVHNSGLAKIKTGQKRFRPDSLLYFMLPQDVRPSLLVDVSEFAEQRLAAIKAYRSQLHDPGSQDPETYLSRRDFLEHVENIHSRYGTLIGRRKAEAFLVKQTIEIPDLVGFFRSQTRSPFI
jgi:bacillithiol biosynthesis deacetylase BshB1